MDDQLARIQERLERHALAEEGRNEREQAQEDRGIGFLVWVARREARMLQADLARRLRTSRAAVSRWEAGRKYPSLLTLERVAQACGLELLLGLRHPDAPDDEFVALGAVQDEWPVSYLRMLHDYRGGSYSILPTSWRQRVDLELGFSTASPSKGG